MTIESILRSKSGKLITVSPETPLGSAAEVLHRNNVGAALVMLEEELHGVLSDRGIVRAMAQNPTGFRDMRADQAMKPKDCIISPSATLEDAMRMMVEKKVRYVPVYEDGNLVGVVSIGDVVMALLQRQTMTVESLSAYIAG